ncbi:MAG: prepilin peptidase [Methanosphaera sp.]|nr:prepilin peptidase [Methanosphaera sp.]
MTLETIIKILAIIIVIGCCIIATYTDVKRQIIPNELTFSTIILGLSLTSLYFYIMGKIDIFYYLTILVVFMFSYILWRLNVWAGGDVKLFTAISTLFIPDFLDILPRYHFANHMLPVGLLSFKIPTFIVIFNSLVSVVPLILIYLSYEIIKNKPYLKVKLQESIEFNKVFLSLNSLIISYAIIYYLHVDFIIYKWILLVILSFVISRIIGKEGVLIIVSLLVLSYQVLTANFLIYLEELTLILIVITTINIFKSGIVKEALTDYVDVDNLEEGMILSKSIYYNNELYTFRENSFKRYDEGKLIVQSSVAGLSFDDIKRIKNSDLTVIPIKKSLSFAPFILTGLLITIFLGNLFNIFIYLLELI